MIDDLHCFNYTFHGTRAKSHIGSWEGSLIGDSSLAWLNCRLGQDRLFLQRKKHVFGCELCQAPPFFFQYNSNLD